MNASSSATTRKDKKNYPNACASDYAFVSAVSTLSCYDCAYAPVSSENQALLSSIHYRPAKQKHECNYLATLLPVGSS